MIEATEAGHGMRQLQAELEDDGRWRVGIGRAADGEELANIWLTRGMLLDWCRKVLLAGTFGEAAAAYYIGRDPASRLLPAGTPLPEDELAAVADQARDAAERARRSR